MTKEVTKVELLKTITLGFSETDCLAMEPLFKIYRFVVRKIELKTNCFNDFAHCYYISGDLPNETIIICLLENRKGEIHQVKCCRNLKMDEELASLIIKATLSKLRAGYAFH